MAKPKKNELTVAQQSTLRALGLSENGPEAQKLLALNAERQIVVEKNRTEFSISVNENGNMVIRGCGNRFPLGMRPDTALVLVEHIEEIRKVAQGLIDAESKGAKPETK